MNKFYVSTDKDHLLKETNIDALKENANFQSVEIKVDETKTYQVMDGFGASFTDSAAYLINQVLTDEQKADAMVKLFDEKEGAGISLLRNPMGASDYARNFYNYNNLAEGETDYNLEKFSIAHDLDDVVPLTKWAVQINPNVKVMASPWSAPGWMKTTKSMIAGELMPEAYEVYANYFVKFIQENKKNGVEIYAITPQNEPLYTPGHYPGMLMTSDVQGIFIRDYLKPAFVKNNITTKILCYDHNWDRVDYPLDVIDVAGDAVDGVAWHWYGGRPSGQGQVHRAYPDKEVHFTEGSGGEWIPEFEPAFSNLMRTSIEILRNHSKSLILWNMALDENNGPFVPGFGSSTCRGILKINQQTKQLDYTLDYYGLAHYSKFVRVGATRIDSPNVGDVKSVAFQNPDGSIVTILFNDEEVDKNITLTVKGQSVTFLLKSKSAITVA